MQVRSGWNDQPAEEYLTLLAGEVSGKYFVDGDVAPCRSERSGGWFASQCIDQLSYGGEIRSSGAMRDWGIAGVLPESASDSNVRSRSPLAPPRT